MLLHQWPCLSKQQVEMQVARFKLYCPIHLWQNLEDYHDNMLDNIKLATKSEIQKEIENLEAQFSQKNNELRESFDKWKEYVQNIDKEMRELSVYYNTLKKEIDKREGKNK